LTDKEDEPSPKDSYLVPIPIAQTKKTAARESPKKLGKRFREEKFDEIDIEIVSPISKRRKLEDGLQKLVEGEKSKLKNQIL
jgi:hypothetical protein